MICCALITTYCFIMLLTSSRVIYKALILKVDARVCSDKFYEKVHALPVSKFKRLCKIICSSHETNLSRNILSKFEVLVSIDHVANNADY